MKYFLTGCMLLAVLTSKAQSNFLKGYVITISKDTLNGFVDYKESYRSPTSFRFKSTIEGKVQVFSKNDAEEINISNQAHYSKFIVNVSQSKRDIPSLSVGINLTTLRDTVFLQVLQDGKNVTLYSYEDIIKERFYIKDKEVSEPVELVKEVYLDEVNNAIAKSRDQYLNQLLLLLNKYQPGSKNLEKRVTGLEYKGTALKKITADINGDVVAKSSYNSKFFAGLGLNASNASYRGESSFGNQSGKTNFSPVLTAGVDIYFNPNIGKLLFRTELSFLMNKGDFSSILNETYRPDVTHSFKQYSAVLTPQILYNLYNTSRVKVFLAAGAGLNFSAYADNVSTSGYSLTNTITVEKDKVELETFNLSPQVSAGLTFNKKIQLSATYSFRSVISRYIYYNVYIERISVGVNYFFNRK